MSMRIAAEWLHSCSGCEITFLNIGESLIDLLAGMKFVHMPLLIDHKYYGQMGDEKKMSIPEADVGIVSGGVANEEHLQVLEEMRQRCNILIALGTCASHGGLPALLNSWDVPDAYRQIFRTVTTDNCKVPNKKVPNPLDRVYAVDEKIKIDLMIPGCPPNPEHIAGVLETLINGEKVKLPSKSVCDTCPTVRKGKGDVKKVRRFLDNAYFKPNDPIDKMRCLLEQGLMCMGPVTAAGCARHGAPSCIIARVPCRGCFGPVSRNGNQMLDMMNALVSNGIDFKSVIDRINLLRFSGAHGLIQRQSTREKRRN